MARSPNWIVLAAASVVLTGVSPVEARNVILMVADGAGYSTWEATAMYEGCVGHDLFDGDEWVRLAASTYALRDHRSPSELPPDQQDPDLVYDPALAWDETPEPDGPPRPAGGWRTREYPWYFAGYRWLRRAPDSANTATTLATGRKTFVGAINVDGNGQPIADTIVSLAKQAGMRTGIVSSVPWSHATPAALGGAHNRSRSEYESIAFELLTCRELDVIIGGGHPAYDDDGRPVSPDSVDYYWVGEGAWNHVTGGTRLAPGSTVGADSGVVWIVTAGDIATLDRWYVHDGLEEIRALAEMGPPAPLLVVPRIASTLQADREESTDAKSSPPYTDPFLETVPTLSELTRAALTTIGGTDDGFFLHVEGGAVDWAMHGNMLGRTVEELMDFKAAVRTVIEWVERESSWDDTLLIVTADHDHLLLGPNADQVPFDALEDRGAGELPGHLWLSNHHTNALVPVFARGAGSEQLRTLAAGADPERGAYLDQTDIFRVMAAAVGTGRD